MQVICAIPSATICNQIPAKIISSTKLNDHMIPIWELSQFSVHIGDSTTHPNPGPGCPSHDRFWGPCYTSCFGLSPPSSTCYFSAQESSPFPGGTAAVLPHLEGRRRRQLLLRLRIRVGMRKEKEGGTSCRPHRNRVMIVVEKRHDHLFRRSSPSSAAAMLKPHLLVVTHHPIRKPLRRRPLPQIYPHLPSRRSSLIQILNLLVDLLQFLVNQPGEIVEVREDQAVQPFPRQALEHHLGYLLLPVLLVLLLQLLARLGDPLPDKPLLVHHLLALLHLRHPLELRHHPLRPRRAWPHLRLVLVRAVNYRACLDPAQRAQLAHLLHQPLLPLLQRRLSS
nr:predicted protein [Ipomoea batatas]